MTTSPVTRSNSQCRPKLTADFHAHSSQVSISSATVTRANDLDSVALAFCSPSDTSYRPPTANSPFLPQYKPELFHLSEWSPTDTPSFWDSIGWLKTLATMGNSGCKDETLIHLLRVEERTLVERQAEQWTLTHEDADHSFSAESTTDSLSMPHPTSTKTTDVVRAFLRASARILADRSRDVLTQHTSDGCSESELLPEGIAKSTRTSVVIWMKRVVESMKWPVSVFFTAVHAMDYTLPSELRMNGGYRTGRSAGKAEAVIPLLSVACVLVGVSSECEHKHLSKTRCFVGQVPNVSSVKEIICKELSVVSRLNRGSLLHKTPVDFVLYFIARLERFDSRLSAVEGSYNSLYRMVCNSQIVLTSTGRHIGQILTGESALQSELLNCLLCNVGDDCGCWMTASAERILSVLLEVTLTLSLTLFSECLHRVVPASRLIALSMMHILSLFCPGMREAGVCAEMSEILFCLDYTNDLAPLWPCLFNVYDLGLRGQQTKTGRLSTCSSSGLLILEILAEGRGQHLLPSVMA